MGWRQSEDSISFSFENAYQAAVVRNDKNLIKDAIREVTGQDFIIEVEVVQTKTADPVDDGHSLDRQVDAVKKVFRGEVI